MDNVGKTPFWGRCGKCAHEWVILWTPMTLEKFAKLAKAQMCPKCHEEKEIFCGRDESVLNVIPISNEVKP